MHKFGLLGGTSWYSTVDYYSALNEAVNKHFGDNTNPPLYLVNMNQKHIHDLEKSGDWGAVADILSKAGQELQSIGVTGLALCANTTHRVYDQVQGSLHIQVLHIGDAIGKVIQKKGWKKVGLLGTVYTMEGDFIRGRLRDEYDVVTLVPNQKARARIQSFLYEEMSIGLFTTEAQDYFLHLIEDLKQRGAEAVILGCTEFPILMKNINTPLPKLNSTECHVEDIVNFILKN